MTSAIRTRLAPAKVNLFLHVLGRRTDGYHELDSLVVFADIGDRLSVTPAREVTALALTGPFAGALADTPPTDNSVARAAGGLAALHVAMREAPPAPIHITLEKILPVAAGLGGGSADAAAAIALLCEAWDFDPGVAALAALAGRLGADVPVCLAGTPARMRGIGERLEPVEVPALDLLLVNPGVPLSTRAVFEALSPAEYSGPAPDRPLADFFGWLAATRNDLEGPARRLCPPIDAALAGVAAAPGCRLARLSGSGPTVLGLFGSAEEARAAARALAAAHPDWWIRAASTRLSRNE
ncbi:MAG: 4-(cytidine 5'-diphospho)-2-C-methyl-D-erythritol kinase [Alphaproteobacteria bacterium]|nr:4-(cytidine 5'-diphospho)-2-C-methyl-D-erythritol kinase [Alphaproteobacteria bacterium]